MEPETIEKLICPVIKFSGQSKRPSSDKIGLRISTTGRKKEKLTHGSLETLIDVLGRCRQQEKHPRQKKIAHVDLMSKRKNVSWRLGRRERQITWDMQWVWSINENWFIFSITILPYTASKQIFLFILSIHCKAVHDRLAKVVKPDPFSMYRNSHA